MCVNNEGIPSERSVTKFFKKAVNLFFFISSLFLLEIVPISAIESPLFETVLCYMNKQLASGANEK